VTLDRLIPAQAILVGASPDRTYIERLRDEFAIPMVYVTHSRPEIEQLRAEVVRIEDGHAVAR
jgi:ABC-type molybdate transport system ATPase subunit